MNYFVLHGHFYQPPRENPWTGIIDRQESAYPYNDWNSRINAECYAASTRTPVYENNEIVKMVNCFEYLSFNIGPTLLSWMEKTDPKTIEKIVEGDRVSRIKNGGHGNAIAQVYNHMIMPLATERDQYTQIIWGLEDFRTRFGRESEGIWLGETAINNETAAIMVDCGIKYAILSPFQAGNVIIDGNKHNVVGGVVDPTQPYKLHTKNGELAIFFYDPRIASEVSFGGALGDASHLYGMVQHELSKQHDKEVKLVHTATDGEVYGHHKNFGNMALAKLAHDLTITSSPSFEFTNYGYFLENHPPQIECELFLGDHGEGSSWSCAHGVGRWIRDCGCHTGGEDSWNQKWRTPLRESFDILRDELYRVAESTDLIKDIWEARNDYFKPISKRKKEYYEEFFTKHQKRQLTSDERKHVLKIMEAMRYSMLTYTSCGWFFNDIAGLEPIQDMLYAVRAYEFSKELLDESIIEKFRSVLSTAQSNILPDNGVEILDKSVKKYKISKESFIEYICWLTICGKTSDSNEYVVEVISEDFAKKEFIISMIDTIGEQLFIMCTLENDTYNLLWKEVPQATTDWSISKSDWNMAQISSLPLFLRVQFIFKNVEFLDALRYTHTLILNAAWNAEKLLLPYEKEMLSFHFTSQIRLFAEDIKNHKNIENIEIFVREIELIKNIISSEDGVVFFLEPLIKTLENFIQYVIFQKNTETLRSARMLFWSVKKYIDPMRLDILRNEMYHFSQTGIDDITDTSFLVEFNTLMRDMGFTTK